MALFELVSGDFERESVRLRYSEAGRAYLRLTSVDGVVEDIFLENAVAGVAESGEGRVGEYLARWAERDGFTLRDHAHEAKRSGEANPRNDGRADRLVVVLLRDGRKFVARGTLEAIAEIKAASMPAGRHAKLAGLDAARTAVTGDRSGLLPRFVPGLLARFLPNR